MIYLYTNKDDGTCHEIHGCYGRPVHSGEVASLLEKGWKKKPELLEEIKPEESLSTLEEAKLLGIETEVDGVPIHHRTLAKLIKEAKANVDNEG